MALHHHHFGARGVRVAADDWGLVLQGPTHATTAVWVARKGHQLTVVGGNAVWLTGGYAGGGTYLNDVWITTDLSASTVMAASTRVCATPRRAA